MDDTEGGLASLSGFWLKSVRRKVCGIMPSVGVVLLTGRHGQRSHRVLVDALMAYVAINYLDDSRRT